jgi:TldD protein
MTKEGVVAAAKEAAAIAKANRLARDRRVELAPAPSYPNASWRGDYEVDPWNIALEEKTDLLLKANAEALKIPGVRFVNSGLSFVKDERSYANTDGSVIIQEFIRAQPNVQITAISADSSAQTRGNIAPPASAGGEYIRRSISRPTWGNGPYRRCRNSPPSRSR